MSLKYISQFDHNIQVLQNIYSCSYCLSQLFGDLQKDLGKIALRKASLSFYNEIPPFEIENVVTFHANHDRLPRRTF